MKKMNKKGFTLMEMLIVVAIIAVLIAIAIPVFGNQLEKSREAVDAANLRAAYAEVLADLLVGDTDAATVTGKVVDQKQTKANWTTTFDWPENFDVDDPAAAGSWKVTSDADGNVTAAYTATP